MQSTIVMRITALLALLYCSAAHPVYQHHFNNIVNSNPCLKKCMDAATQVEGELSLLKTSNISGYLLDLELICNTISTAKACIDSCGVDSNPFALESMNAICQAPALADVQLISPCLSEKGDAMLSECKNECGDYEQVNDEVHKMTEEFKPEVHQPSKVADVLTKTNEACGVLKCSNRCATKKMSEQCGLLKDGRNVGTVVRSLVESVLVAQRRDLERMQLVDTMAQSTPPACNFMYNPEALFSEAKDNLAMAMIGEQGQQGHEQKVAAVSQPLARVGGEDKRKEMNLALSQFQGYLMRKQLHLLEIQEKNLIREGEKLEMELQLLARKRAQAMNEDKQVVF